MKIIQPKNEKVNKYFPTLVETIPQEMQGIAKDRE